MIHKVIHRVILASQSQARADLLKAAGIDFEARPAYLDEVSIKNVCQKQGKTPAETALILAIEKARTVNDPEAFIVGADQILVSEGRWFDKAESLEEAREQLSFLQGKIHELPSAACIIHRGEIVWQVVQTLRLHMRPMTKAEITNYLDEAGETVLTSLGCYKLELMGKRLFTHIEGDRAAIIGLPVAAILDFLKTKGFVANGLHTAWDSGEWNSAFTVSAHS